MRDVLEKRFGLKGGRKKTLEAIGGEYKITRERVRQIEADAFRNLVKPEMHREVEPLFKAMEDTIKNHGDVMAEEHLFTTLTSSRTNAHIAFLLHVGRPFASLPETASFHRRWTINRDTAAKAQKIMDNVVGEMDKGGAPVSQKELQTIVSRNAASVLGQTPAEHVLQAYLATSRLLRQNPYGEYGLISWPTINPRGVKDKAYLVLSKTKEPMHFREVANAINKTSWSRRRAHPQTVHNELIKDQRFVLVGRGLYALREWGYEPGTVRDVLVSIFKNASRPLHKDEVMKLVMEKRMVKAPTILLNLQNKSTFRRADDGKYTLV